MDLIEMIRQLHQERERLNHIIGALEAVADGDRPRRGRRSMSPEERQSVSDRMRRYWAKRRRQAAGKKTEPTG